MKRVFFAILSMMPGAVAAQSFGYTGTPATCMTNCPINAVLPYYTSGATISFTGNTSGWSIGSGLSAGSGFTISNINQNDPANIMAANVIASMYINALNSSYSYPGSMNWGNPYAMSTGSGSLIVSDHSGYYGASTQFALQTAFGSTQTAAVPEPASWAMMILGLGLMGFALRRRAAERAGEATFA